jgi:hypothetical protein
MENKIEITKLRKVFTSEKEENSDIIKKEFLILSNIKNLFYKNKRIKDFEIKLEENNFKPLNNEYKINFGKKAFYFWDSQLIICGNNAVILTNCNFLDALINPTLSPKTIKLLTLKN